MYTLGWDYFLEFPNPSHPFTALWKRVARETPMWGSGEKQMPDRVKRGPKPGVPLLGIVGGLHYTVSEAKQHIPPIMKFVGTLAASAAEGLPSHGRIGVVNYYQKPVERVGHKPDRMNGFQRSCWGAATHAHLNGYFPHWDPLHRHPDETDFLNGEMYTGPFPQTP